jgi:glycosyltransferase involved in cell wall biosynthesis
MPAYNEERTIERAVRVVLGQSFPCPVELIVVNDGSKDATGELLAAIDDPRARVHHHPRNMGKGAALQTAAALATGTHIVPFDADLEYAPSDVARMLEPILEDRCDIVYGTRLFGANTVYQSYRHAMGNRALTLAANLLFDSYLSDMHTCLKMIPLDLFRQLDVRENGFGLDTEITAKILKLGVRPFEVPVSYHSRSIAMGKKITWVDGFECLQVLSRVRFGKATVVTPIVSARARTTALVELDVDAAVGYAASDAAVG